MIILLIVLSLGSAAVAIAFPSLWWLILVSFGLALTAAIASVMRPFRVPGETLVASEAPNALHDQETTWTARYLVFRSWTREQLLRPGIDNLDPTHRFEDDPGDAEPLPRAV